MDFTNLLKAIEEFLFELVSWLVFYPITLWRSVVHPQATMRYAASELKDRVEDQFDDTLSPPIFLLVSLLLAHGIELAFPVPDTAELPQVFQDERNLLLFRAVAFSLFPLLFSVVGVRRKLAKLTRRSLQPDFYAQCFVAAPFVLAADVGVILLRHGGMVAVSFGLAIIGTASIWYIVVQVDWLGSVGVNRPAAIAAVCALIALGCILIVTLGIISALAAFQLQ